MTAHPLIRRPLPELRPSRPTVLFGRHYSWVFAGGRWCLLADPAADARASRVDDARQRVLDALDGAARLVGKAAR